MRLLMGIDYADQLDLATINLLFEHGEHSAEALSEEAQIANHSTSCAAYSGGFAGSMMVASLVLSSLTR
jgi:hypothetical protein